MAVDRLPVRAGFSGLARIYETGMNVLASSRSEC